MVHRRPNGAVTLNHAAASSLTNGSVYTFPSSGSTQEAQHGFCLDLFAVFLLSSSGEQVLQASTLQPLTT